jgi:hypothetical protein
MRVSDFRKSWFLTLLMAFLLNAVLPFVASYAAIPEEQPTSTAEFLNEVSTDGKILICTENGFEYVDIADLGDLPDHKTPTHHAPECGLCFIHAHNMAVFITPSIDIAAILYPLSHGNDWGIYNDADIVKSSITAHASRAPPVSL